LSSVLRVSRIVLTAVQCPHMLLEQCGFFPSNTTLSLVPNQLSGSKCLSCELLTHSMGKGNGLATQDCGRLCESGHSHSAQNGSKQRGSWMFIPPAYLLTLVGSAYTASNVRVTCGGFHSDRQTEKDPANHALSPASQRWRLADAGQLLHGTVTPKCCLDSASSAAKHMLDPCGRGAHDRLGMPAMLSALLEALFRWQATAEPSPVMERHGCRWAHHCPSLAFAAAVAVLLTAALAPTAAEGELLPEVSARHRSGRCNTSDVQLLRQRLGRSRWPDTGRPAADQVWRCHLLLHLRPIR